MADAAKSYSVNRVDSLGRTAELHALSALTFAFLAEISLTSSEHPS
jgi:hypothetical protein